MENLLPIFTSPKGTTVYYLNNSVNKFAIKGTETLEELKDYVSSEYSKCLNESVNGKHDPNKLFCIEATKVLLNTGTQVSEYHALGSDSKTVLRTYRK